MKIYKSVKRAESRVSLPTKAAIKDCEEIFNNGFTSRMIEGVNADDGFEVVQAYIEASNPKSFIRRTTTDHVEAFAEFMVNLPVYTDECDDDEIITWDMALSYLEMGACYYAPIAQGQMIDSFYSTEIERIEASNDAMSVEMFNGMIANTPYGKLVDMFCDMESHNADAWAPDYDAYIEGIETFANAFEFMSHSLCWQRKLNDIYTFNGDEITMNSLMQVATVIIADIDAFMR